MKGKMCGEELKSSRMSAATLWYETLTNLISHLIYPYSIIHTQGPYLYLYIKIKQINKSPENPNHNF